MADVDLARADIGLIAALPWEIAPLLRRCEKVRRYKAASFVMHGGRYRGIKLAAAEAGMGFARARTAAQAMIDGHNPDFVLAVGFSGALQSGLRVGDVVVANALVDEHGQSVALDLAMPASPESGLHVGRLLTSDRLIRRAEEKLELGRRYDALAVDLESLAVAQVCRERKRRFMAVRVVSDDAASDLPEEILTIAGPTGSVRWGAALGALWRRPGSAGELWRLRSVAQQCGERLAAFLEGVLVQLHPPA
jgi:adenosylhomocysteine nucleosidase